MSTALICLGREVYGLNLSIRVVALALYVFEPTILRAGDAHYGFPSLDDSKQYTRFAVCMMAI